MMITMMKVVHGRVINLFKIRLVHVFLGMKMSCMYLKILCVDKNRTAASFAKNDTCSRQVYM